MPESGLTIDVFIPLTPEECAERDRLDTEMDETEKSAIAYIRDLKTYRDKNLWRGPYKSFDEYLASRRKVFSRKRFGQLATQVVVTDNLIAQGVKVLPLIERQTRELAHLKDPAEQAAVWLNAQAASGEEQPSYSWVRSSAETWEQAKADGQVYVGEGRGELLDADSLKKGTVNTEDERVNRMLDHIKANRRTKPLAVFQAAPTAIFNGTWLSMNIPAEVADKLRVGQQVRFVVYSVIPKTNEVKA